MIQSKEDLKAYLNTERPLYIDGGKLTSIKLWLLRDSRYLIWHYVKMLRYTEYYCNTGKRIRYIISERRMNKEGARLGFSIYHNSIGKGLQIYHYGNIIVNSNAKIGENLKLHGNNCIGNKGDHDKFRAPTIGDNVELGVGAQILGDIRIASNVTVAANAAVVKSCDNEHVILAGVPAKIIRGGV